MVIALTRSDSFGATDAKQEKAWREAYAKGNPLPTDQPSRRRGLTGHLEHTVRPLGFAETRTHLWEGDLG